VVLGFMQLQQQFHVGESVGDCLVEMALHGGKTVLERIETRLEAVHALAEVIDTSADVVEAFVVEQKGDDRDQRRAGCAYDSYR
jgi:hypothetical protein